MPLFIVGLLSHIHDLISNISDHYKSYMGLTAYCTHIIYDIHGFVGSSWLVIDHPLPYNILHPPNQKQSRRTVCLHSQNCDNVISITRSKSEKVT